MKITENILSPRYHRSLRSHLRLNETQEKVIGRFLQDSRIRFERLSHCQLCGNDSYSLVATIERYGLPLETVICEKCGIVFSLNQLTEESTKIFYEEYYRVMYDAQEDLVEAQRRLDEAARHKRMPAFLKKGDVVLEIGTGAGWRLLKYKNQGLKVYGFDYGTPYIEFGKKYSGLNLFYGSIDEAAKMNIHAKYTILSHVLEHTKDPIAFLIKLGEAIEETGYLRIEVPSLNYLIVGGGATGYDLLGTLQLAHNFLFDEFTLRYALVKSGYEIIYLFGGSTLVRKRRSEDARLVDKLERRLQNGFRGPKQLAYLHLCEKLVPLKDRLISPSLDLHLHLVYYMSKPFEIIKALWKYFRKDRADSCSSLL